MSLSILPSALPSKQFTAGSLLKQYPGAKLADVRDALDRLVDAGKVSVKVAGSGARNYKVKAGAVDSPPADVDEWEDPPRPGTLDAETAVTGASTNKVERAKLAGDEAKAVKAWEEAGEKGDRPATPNLDAINAGKQAKADRAADPNKPKRGTSVQFVVDDKPMPASQNKLSSVAWYHTKGCGGDVARISSGALQAYLAERGVADPSNSVGWSVDLGNGKVLSAVPLD